MRSPAGPPARSSGELEHPAGVTERQRLDLAYDGTEFAGWARQPGRRTVEGELAEALRVVLRLAAPPRLTVAGRTDAGVHATGQVAHADLPPVSPQLLQRRLNRLLPSDVRVLAASRAPSGFDARFSALSRRYRYRICDGVLDPLRRRDTASHGRRLEVSAMAAAATGLLGEHDFAAFCRARPEAGTVRRLLAVEPVRAEDDVVVVEVEADAFCHQMVRSLIGALVVVAEGRRPVDWPAGLLAARRRDPRVQLVAARGLTLIAVRYPDPAGAAEQAGRARRRRGPASAATARPAADEAAPGALTVRRRHR